MNRLLFCYLLLLCSPLAFASKLEVYTDTSSAGWAYKDSCVAFKMQIGGGRYVLWTVEKTKAEFGNQAGNLTLYSRPETYAPLSFKAVTQYHKIILDSIFNRWPAYRFTALPYFSFHHGTDYSWNIPVAFHSATSKKYAHFRKNYPKTPHNLNELFVEFANRSNAYKELKSLFNKYGLTVRLKSVEKVFVAKVSKLEFKDALLKLGLKTSDQVLYDVGMSHFTLMPDTQSQN